MVRHFFENLFRLCANPCTFHIVCHTIIFCIVSNFHQSNNIRTIIKARGLVHPNITGKTFAVFRVDSENHLISFVSTILPSPDWFVGVSALELCQSDCTWIENKVLELYPWDAGTRDGISYQVRKDLSKNITISIGIDPFFSKIQFDSKYRYLEYGQD